MVHTNTLLEDYQAVSTPVSLHFYILFTRTTHRFIRTGLLLSDTRTYGVTTAQTIPNTISHAYGPQIWSIGTIQPPSPQKNVRFSLFSTGFSAHISFSMNSRTRQVSACLGRHIHVRHSNPLSVIIYSYCLFAFACDTPSATTDAVGSTFRRSGMSGKLSPADDRGGGPWACVIFVFQIYLCRFQRIERCTDLYWLSIIHTRRYLL